MSEDIDVSNGVGRHKEAERNREPLSRERLDEILEDLACEADQLASRPYWEGYSAAVHDVIAAVRIAPKSNYCGNPVPAPAVAALISENDDLRKQRDAAQAYADLVACRADLTEERASTYEAERDEARADLAAFRAEVEDLRNDVRYLFDYQIEQRLSAIVDGADQ